MGERLGWNAIVASGKAIGANDLDWTDDAHGSVSDCATLLRKLASGKVLSQSSRDYYIQLMRTQVYRKGIPAGTSYDVADKVGFLGPQLNDAGIVFAPDLTHIIVIYTNGESWNTIAEITRRRRCSRPSPCPTPGASAIKPCRFCRATCHLPSTRLRAAHFARVARWSRRAVPSKRPSCAH